MSIPRITPFHDLDLYHLSDENPEQYPAGRPWMAVTADNHAVFLARQEEAAALQRHWRQLHGRDAHTGDRPADVKPSTMNPVDLLDCRSGHHDYSDDHQICRVCGHRSDADDSTKRTPFMDLDTPQGRAAAAEALGPDGYNKAMADHIAETTVAAVNGYRLRWVSSRFGRLCQVVGTEMAFPSLDAATAYADALPYHNDPAVTHAFAGFSTRQRDAILAALRLLAHTLESRPTSLAPNGRDLDDILTSGGKHPRPTATEIQDLYDGLLSGDFDPD